MGNAVDLVAARHPFKVQRERLELPAGGTVADMLRAADAWPAPGCRVHVTVGGAYVPRAAWPQVRPGAGELVTVRAVPAGGGNGAKVTRTLLTIAVIAAALYAGPAAAGLLGLTGTAATVGGAVVSAGVMFGGTLAVNALVPPPLPALSGRGAESPSQSPSLTATRNRAHPYRAVPRPFGRVRWYPPFGALPYTEIVGSDQYLRQLFCLGYGPVTVSDLKIGETALTAFEGVDYEVIDGGATARPTLYTHDVTEAAPAVTLTLGGAWATRTTEPDTTEIGLDVTLPAGLVWYEDNGHKHEIDARFSVEVSPAGAGTWSAPTFARVSGAAVDHGAGVFGVTATQPETLRLGVAWPVSSGQYDVRVKFSSASSTSTSDDRAVGVDVAGTEPVWSALRSFQAADVVGLDGLAWVALRIKATDQLSGIVDGFNCVTEARLPAWNGTGWDAAAITRNPAWAFCEVLKGAANRRPVTDARLDLAGLKDWADKCTAEGWTFDAVVDFDTTAGDLLRDLAAVGRAAPSVIDGLHGVVIDQAQTVPVQHFTPRNSWGFKGSKAFPTTAHALRVRYTDATTGRQAERVVYDDGYDAATATRFEELELWGVTDPDQAWKTGRYYLAVGRLRPEVYELNADLEHLVCTRGDLVRVSHDVALWGSGWGRVKSLTGTPGAYTAVTLDEVLTLEAAKTYQVRLRLADGSSVVAPVQNPGAGAYDTLTFTTPRAEDLAAGDLVLFGEVGLESVELIVKAIHPGADLSARLELVDAAPAVHTADTGTIPAFDPQITHPAPLPDLTPPAPVFVSILADEFTADQTGGAWVGRLVVSVAPLAGWVEPLADLEVQYRRNAGGLAVPWLRAGLYPAEGALGVVAPVTVGETYDVRVRWVTATGRTSPWAVGASSVVVGDDTVAPAVPSGFTATFGPRVTWTWARNLESDFSHYLASLDAWASQARLDGPAAEVVDPTARAYTLEVKAVDRAGNVSAAASSTATLAAPGTPAAADVAAEVADNVAHLSVLATYTRSAAHVGFGWRWSADAGATWTTPEDPTAAVTVAVAPGAFGGASSLDLWVQVREVDAVGPGAWSPTATVTLSAPAPSLPLDVRGWGHDLAFTADDNETVSWAAGSIHLADGTTYTIGAGSTGTMATASVRYVYLDTAVSLSALQLSTAIGDAVGAGKIFVAAAQRVSDAAKLATFQVFGGAGVGPLVVADNIAANSVGANELAANITYTGQLIATDATVKGSAHAGSSTLGYLVSVGKALKTGSLSTGDPGTTDFDLDGQVHVYDWSGTAWVENVSLGVAPGAAPYDAAVWGKSQATAAAGVEGEGGTANAPGVLGHSSLTGGKGGYFEATGANGYGLEALGLTAALAAVKGEGRDGAAGATLKGTPSLYLSAPTGTDDHVEFEPYQVSSPTTAPTDDAPVGALRALSNTSGGAATLWWKTDTGTGGWTRVV